MNKIKNEKNEKIQMHYANKFYCGLIGRVEIKNVII